MQKHVSAFTLIELMYIMQKHVSAFTLIELMLTLAVAAVVLTLGVPSFGRIVENNQLATNVNFLVQSMTMARSEAVKRNKRVSICDSADATNCGGGNYEQGWIVFVDEKMETLTVQLKNYFMSRVLCPPVLQ